MKTKRNLIRMCLLGAMLMVLPTVAQAQTYETLEATNIFAFGISGGNIVGAYRSGEGFLFNGSTTATLSDPAYQYTIATGISGSNIVGWCTDGAEAHGFLYNGTTYITLDDPNAAAVDSPTLIPPGGYSYLLGTYQFDGWGGTFPAGISGTNVVGWYVGANGQTHGFLYNGSTYSTLNDPNGVGATYAQGISGNNIVGWYVGTNGQAHGFLYNGTTYTTLDDPNGVGTTYAQGISGTNIVGYYTAGGYGYGFLYNGSTYATLEDVNGVSTSAQGISSNTIVGWYISNRIDYGFTCTLGNSQAGSLQITIVPTNAVNAGTNGLLLMLQRPVGSNYVIQASSNLVTWLPITNFVSTNSPYYFNDPSATNYSRRFYRAVTP